MPAAGLEPARLLSRGILSPLCLPIPPSGLSNVYHAYLSIIYVLGQELSIGYCFYYRMKYISFTSSDIKGQNMEFIVVYASMLVIYVIVDFVWITLFMQPYFTANLGHLLRESVGTSFLITYGCVFFIFYVSGLYWFGVRAGIGSNSAITATLSGGFLGFLAYGTYGLTNFIFFKGYFILWNNWFNKNSCRKKWNKLSI